ncbi:protein DETOXIFICATION 49-like [Populus nigra]|uniref:protein DETOXIFICATION 49-like n=1 Tax=Populus nigra TaxID=3691 RepID=UPI002B265534|nr:protein DETOXIFICATION 49-like [Populus nigra]
MGPPSLSLSLSLYLSQLSPQVYKCQLSSPSDSSKSKVDPSTRVQGSDMLTALIPENPIFQEQHKTDHLSLAIKEARCIAIIALPMILTGLLLYSRSMISMLFLGRLGELALAGGSLAIGFANITGYSILSGLSMGMEPICGQAFGAKRYKLLGITLQRTILLLFLTSISIAFLWFNMKKILLFCGQEDDIATEAQFYTLYSLPDLIHQSILHPLRIYLRTQSITLPLTFCAALSILLHIPINYLLVSVLNLGIKGVALSEVWTNFSLVGSLIIYVMISGVYKKTWGGISLECFKGWKSLLNLASISLGLSTDYPPTYPLACVINCSF